MATHEYDFDLAVIGAGSAGVRLARMAASRGVRVVVFEKAAMGGTCVNVGCVPKKLMHRAALLGQSLHDAHHFGWSADASSMTMDWAKLVTNTRNHVRMLNFCYKKGLQQRSNNHRACQNLTLS